MCRNGIGYGILDYTMMCTKGCASFNISVCETSSKAFVVLLIRYRLQLTCSVNVFAQYLIQDERSFVGLAGALLWIKKAS